MEITDVHWRLIRQLFEDAFKSSFHYSIATVSENGSPHVTPIGSLILRDDKTGFYFEEYTKHLQLNLQHNNRVCVMAVNSSMWDAWKSFILGRFISLPAVRLMGIAGERREATQEELRLSKNVSRNSGCSRHTIYCGAGLNMCARSALTRSSLSTPE